jgi:hypothetical protein
MLALLIVPPFMLALLIVPPFMLVLAGKSGSAYGADPGARR